jgi:hypothetical protein
VANYANDFAWLDAEVDFVQRLERSEFFNRLSGELPPLVERGGF